MSAAGLDPRHIEEVLGRSLKDLLGRLRADGALVLLGDRAGRFIVRAPVGLDGTLLLAVGELASTRPEELPALYARSGFTSSMAIPLEMDGVYAGELHLVAHSELATASALVQAGRSLAPLAFALRGLEAARAADERAEVVSQVARGLLHHLELSSLFPELIRLVSRLCPCDGASVAIYEKETDTFELVAIYGPDLPDLIRAGTVIPARETPMWEAWVTGELVSDPDGRASRYPRSRVVAAAGLVSVLYIPVGEPRRALLCVGHRLPYRFGDDEVALYRSFVPFLEIALRNAELVGDIRAAYRELESTQERLVATERLRALGELAAEVAHDVGNALAIVACHAELVGKTVRDDATRQLVTACLKAVEDATRSVRSVLDLARGETPSRSTKLRYELDKVAREAALFVAPRMSDAGQELDTSGLLPVPEAVGDPGEVREAIVNLVMNAIDATPRGGTISLATCVAADSAVLAIEDSGPGVRPELAERIFEPFFTTKGPGHVGLGLARVARVTRQLGGTVRVAPSSLGGARFEVRLPLREIGSGPHELPRVRRGAKLTRAVEVLLVEDEPSLRGALSALLGLRGHKVVTAGDVSEALSILGTRSSIEVVVTDLGLPGRSGWELVDALRGRTPPVPVIVLSGVGALTDPEQARERGVAAVLSKPTSEQDLAATIEHLVH